MLLTQLVAARGVLHAVAVAAVASHLSRTDVASTTAAPVPTTEPLAEDRLAELEAGGDARTMVEAHRR